MTHQMLDEDFINLDKSNKEDVYVYLTTPGKNKAGQYTRESGFKKNFPKLYSDYLDYFDKDKYDTYPFNQLLYHYFNNDKFMSIGICKNEKCSNRCKFNDFKTGYYDFCSSKCSLSSEIHKEKVRQTCIKKYGVDCVLKDKEIKKKIKDTRLDKYGSMCSDEAVQKAKKTKLEKYGNEKYVNTEKMQQTKLERYGDSGYHNVEKMQQTKLDRYGDSGYHNVEKMQQTKLERYGDSGYHNIEQMKQTNLERYGVEYYSQLDEFDEKIYQTKLERYGDSGYHNIEQMKQTNLERYGVEYAQNSDIIKEKIKCTNLKRYGNEYAIGSDTVRKKIVETSIDKYDDTNPYRGKLHRELIKKFPELIGFSGNKYICKCLNINCDACEKKQFELPSPIFRRRKNQGIELCPILNPILVSDGTSDIENDIYLYIKSIYSGKIIQNDRSILNGKEIDIYLPEMNLAIEFNGLYWHSEVYKDKMYHQEKTILCENKGIQLIHIWEDDWLDKKDIVKDIIQSKLGMNDKIPARKCTIKEVLSKESKEFLEKYHIQGNVNASIRIGLYYDDSLVEIATFGKLRNILHSNGQENQYELYRLCSKSGYTVVGGVSKLLTHFIRKYQPKQIVSYANLDISNGNVYNSFFKKISITSPGYYWSKDGYKYHRSNFTKHILVKNGYDKNKTEEEIMHELGYYKVYDSGNIKYVWEC